MKPFLGIDITDNKRNDVFNGDEFLVSTASDEATQALENSLEQADKIINKAKLPTILRVIQYICCFAWIVVAGGIIKGMKNVDLKTAYANAPELFWVCGVCFIVWGVITLAAISKAKSVSNSSEAQAAANDLDTMTDEIFDELDVPEDAVAVDILSFCYKIKKGVPVAKSTKRSFGTHFNFEYHAFVRNQKLYLANVEAKYEFPFSELKGIVTVDKRITMPEWNKDIPPNVGPYKQYKMNVDNFRCIHAKPYHILKVLHDGEMWGIYFPCYELDTFENLTGFNAQ